jgi:transcriptional regulator GlxA family with amidase domain
VKCLGGSRRLSELRFREMMGHSILDEIMNIRLEKVCFLLSRTDTAIGAIAAQCGFGSDIALSKLFHRRFDMSLLAWRKQSRAVR